MATAQSMAQFSLSLTCVDWLGIVILAIAMRSPACQPCGPGLAGCAANGTPCPAAAMPEPPSGAAWQPTQLSCT